MFKTLLVEDNAPFRQSLKEILCERFTSMVVAEVADGREVLGKVSLFRPDLVFMDIKLPGENGLELTREIKLHHPKTVVVILTSYDLPEYREAAEQYGADYFLSKGSSSREEILGLVDGISSGSNGDLDGPNTVFF